MSDDKDPRKLTSGIGLNHVLTSTSSTPDGEEGEDVVPVPEIPEGFFDEIYALPTGTQCRVPGLVKNCFKTCEPSPDSAQGENLFLLPGEEEYLRKKFGDADVEYLWTQRPPAVVRLKESCPYHQEGVCSIHDLRPFTCRSYPLRCHKIGDRSLAIFSAIGCPFNVPTPEDLATNEHHRRWIGAWKALMPYLSERWWTSFIRACPAGFRHVGDIIDPREEGVPFYMARRHASPDCEDCQGAGLSEQGICHCIDKKARKKLLHEFQQHRKRFTT